MIAIFLFDFVINNLGGGNEYLISFYFWMDIASLILLIFDFSFIRDNIFENQASINKTKAYNFYVILEVLRILRIILLSKVIFRKKFKNDYSYYKNKLLMPSHVIKELKTTKEDIRRNHSFKKSRATPSFNDNKNSQFTLDKRETSASRPPNPAGLVYKTERL